MGSARIWASVLLISVGVRTTSTCPLLNGGGLVLLLM
jgi:hypothetical protein